MDDYESLRPLRRDSEGGIQWDPIAVAVNAAIIVFTTCSIAYSVAVTDVALGLDAVSPDRVLHEPRESRREFPVEGPGVDLLGDQPNDGRTAVGPISRPGVLAARRRRIPVRASKLWTKVSTAIIWAPSPPGSTRAAGQQ